MSLDADTIVDRRRMRRKLTFWRVVAVLIAIAAIVAVGAVPGAGFSTIPLIRWTRSPTGSPAMTP